MKLGVKTYQVSSVLILGFLVLINLGCYQNQAIQNDPIKPQATDSIIGGNPVEGAEREAKSTVALYLDLNREAFLFCSGTLIAPNLILTAAHCLADVANELDMSENELTQILKVGFGLPIVNSAQDARVKFVSAEKIKYHEQYKMGINPSSEAMYDIGLIKLAGVAPEGFTPVTLGTTEQLTKGKKVTVSGYGIVNGFTKDHATELRKVELKIGNPRETLTQFTHSLSFFKGICNGDSGGPMYVENADKSYSVLGVVSWGLAFCSIKGVYTNVPYFAPWIIQSASVLNN